MKRPFDTIRELFAENLDRSRENTKFIFDRADSFMVWIIGFSIGGLSLFISNIGQINKTFNHNQAKCVLILLAVSIISGIIYRIAFSNFQIKFRETEFYIEGAFSSKEIMNIEPEDLTGEKDIKQIVRRTREDFGEDLSYILPIYEQVDQQHKDLLVNDLIKHYQTTGEWVKKDWEFALNYAKDTYQKAFGISKSRVDRIFDEDSSKLLKIWGKIATFSFYISCVSFILVIIISCVLY